MLLNSNVFCLECVAESPVFSKLFYSAFEEIRTLLPILVLNVENRMVLI